MSIKVMKEFLNILRGTWWLGQHTAFLYAKCRGFDGHPTRIDIYVPPDQKEPGFVKLRDSFVPDVDPKYTFLLLYGRNMQHYSLLCKLTPFIKNRKSPTHFTIGFTERRTTTDGELVVLATRLDKRTIAEYENRNSNDELDQSGRSLTCLLLLTLPDHIPHTSYLIPYLIPHTSYLISYTLCIRVYVNW